MTCIIHLFLNNSRVFFFILFSNKFSFELYLAEQNISSNVNPIEIEYIMLGFKVWPRPAAVPATMKSKKKIINKNLLEFLLNLFFLKAIFVRERHRYIFSTGGWKEIIERYRKKNKAELCRYFNNSCSHTKS